MKLQIETGNIVDDKFLNIADAIVNSTNPYMIMGSGVCGAIFKRAGISELQSYTEQTFHMGENHLQNRMKPTEIRVTPGFRIPCEIIFAESVKVFECKNYGDALNLLLKTYENICKTIIEKNYKTVLIPALGTGHYGFKHEQTAKFVVETLKSQLQNFDATIYFIVPNEAIAQIYKREE